MAFLASASSVNATFRGGVRAEFGLFFRRPEPAMEPGAGEQPQPIRGAAGDLQGFRSGLMFESGEISQLDKGGRLRIVEFQLAKRLIHRDRFFKPVVADVKKAFVKVELDRLAAALRPAFGAGMIDKDAAHRFARGREKMTRAVPMRRPGRAARESQVRFVDQCRGVEGVIEAFVRHAGGGKLPQFVVDDGQQAVGRQPVSGADHFQKLRHVAHFARLFA
jgi:hypothetical protein